MLASCSPPADHLTVAVRRALQYIGGKISIIASRVLLAEIFRVYDIGLSYVLLIEEVLEEYHHGTRFSMQDDIDKALHDAMCTNLREAKAFLVPLREEYPLLTRVVNTLKAARKVLNAGINFVDHIKHHGGLAENEAERLSALMKERACAVFFSSAKALDFLKLKHSSGTDGPPKLHAAAQVHPVTASSASTSSTTAAAAEPSSPTSPSRGKRRTSVSEANLVQARTSVADISALRNNNDVTLKRASTMSLTALLPDQPGSPAKPDYP